VGGGQHDSRIMGGMLGLHPSALHHTWSSIAETVGLYIIELGREVMETNRLVEKALSPSVEGKMQFRFVGMRDGTKGVVVGTTPPCRGAVSRWAVGPSLYGTLRL
jgi:hypothetical protein